MIVSGRCTAKNSINKLTYYNFCLVNSHFSLFFFYFDILSEMQKNKNLWSILRTRRWNGLTPIQYSTIWWMYLPTRSILTICRRFPRLSTSNKTSTHKWTTNSIVWYSSLICSGMLKKWVLIGYTPLPRPFYPPPPRTPPSPFFKLVIIRSMIRILIVIM